MIKKNIIEDIKEKIIKSYSPDEIILFGSYAYGMPSEDSDLDLLIISDKEKELPRRKRGLKLLSELKKYHFSKDILIYTSDEIEEWKNVKQAFITEVLDKGIKIYEK